MHRRQAVSVTQLFFNFLNFFGCIPGRFQGNSRSTISFNFQSNLHHFFRVLKMYKIYKIETSSWLINMSKYCSRTLQKTVQLKQNFPLKYITGLKTSSLNAKLTNCQVFSYCSRRFFILFEKSASRWISIKMAFYLPPTTTNLYSVILTEI